MFWSTCIYLLACISVCIYVTNFSRKLLNKNCMKFSEMICHHPRTKRLDFVSDQVKGQGQGHKRPKNYFCHNTLSFRPIHMKPGPKCSLFNSLSSDMPHDKVTSFLWFIGLHVCMLLTFLKNNWTKLNEIFRNDLLASKDQSIRFWERSGQRSRSRSQKDQKLLDRIA